MSLGPLLAAIAANGEVVPKKIANRDRELWQPLLALLACVEDAGADGLLKLMQDHTERVAEKASQDQMPEAEETMLEALAELAKAGRSPTSGEILERAMQMNRAHFDGWTASTVTNRLKNYGIGTPKKVGGKRSYLSVLAVLASVQERYSVDLGITPGDVPGKTGSAA